MPPGNFFIVEFLHFFSYSNLLHFLFTFLSLPIFSLSLACSLALSDRKKFGKSSVKIKGGRLIPFSSVLRFVGHSL